MKRWCNNNSHTDFSELHYKAQGRSLQINRQELSPCCDKCRLHRHGFYDRNCPQHGILLILRFLCVNCGQTISVLPTFLTPLKSTIQMPFSPFSYVLSCCKRSRWKPVTYMELVFQLSTDGRVNSILIQKIFSSMIIKNDSRKSSARKARIFLLLSSIISLVRIVKILRLRTFPIFLSSFRENLQNLSKSMANINHLWGFFARF